MLEALSSAHRTRTGRNELWLRAAGRAFGATECRRAFSGRIEVPRSERICYLLNRFATWLALPPYQGKRWILSTHQGRKTFARFAALRDRSALFALAQHLGHRERAVTDYGYAGTDYRLEAEIDAEVIEQSVSAWEHMLAARQLGGRAGAETLTADTDIEDRARASLRSARNAALDRYGRRIVMPRSAQHKQDRAVPRIQRPQGRAAVRLEQALQELARASDGRTSIAELCRRANVSSNSLYRYHGEILERFRRLPKSSKGTELRKHEMIDKLRAENASLRKQLAQVAALVDHFYVAYQEVQLLLKRRDRELADVRRSSNSRPQVASGA